MKHRLLIFSLFGLISGTGIAWLLPPLGTGHFTRGVITHDPSADPVSKYSSARQKLTDSWQKLLTQGSASWQQRLTCFNFTKEVPAAQIKHLLEVTPLSRTFERKCLIQRWLSRDPTAAGAWAADYLGGKEKIHHLLRRELYLVFSAMAAKDPLGTQSTIQRLDSHDRATYFSHTLLEMLLEKDIRAGIAFGATCKDPERISDINDQWILRDPAQAAALLGSLQPGYFRDYSLSHAIKALTEKNFEAALTLYRKYPAINPSGEFFLEWAKRDPVGLTAHANGEAHATQRPGIKEALAHAMADKDPVGALHWMDENLSGGCREYAENNILKKLTTSDPEAARNYLASRTEGSLLENWVNTFLQTLALPDYQSIFAQAALMAECPARVLITGHAYRDWFRENPDAALQQLANVPPQNLPDGFWSDLGADGFSALEAVGHLKSLPPATGADFVRGICRSRLLGIPSTEVVEVLGKLSDPIHRSALLETIVEYPETETLAGLAKSLTDPEERQKFAASLQKLQGKMLPKDFESMMAPLRQEAVTNRITD